MHRFFVLNPKLEGNRLHWTGNEWHHCQAVLRGKKGDRIALFDGKGGEYLMEINDATDQGAVLHLLQKTATPPPPYSITLAQALPKNKAMDYIIQKATELGARKIIPVLSDRSVVRIEPTEADSKIKRWREISIEAAKQCGLNWLPTITPPQTVKDVVRLHSSYRAAFIGSLQADARPLWNYITDSKSASGDMILMIGPEGDFTPAELGLARSSGFLPLSLGPLVLRCDTAALYALSALSYELSRLK